jgi:hypothetical protein
MGLAGGGNDGSGGGRGGLRQVALDTTADGIADTTRRPLIRPTRPHPQNPNSDPTSRLPVPTHPCSPRGTAPARTRTSLVRRAGEGGRARRAVTRRARSAMSYELGVEMDRGAGPLHRTLYVRVMPRLTISNRSGLVLQVPPLPQPPRATLGRRACGCARAHERARRPGTRARRPGPILDPAGVWWEWVRSARRRARTTRRR